MPKDILAILIFLALFFIFILTTNPKEISLAAILIPFILLGAAFYKFINLMIEKLFKKSTKKGKLKLFAIMGTVIIINFALLSSVGQLTFQDILLTGLIIIVGSFYLYKFQIS